MKYSQKHILIFLGITLFIILFTITNLFIEYNSSRKQTINDLQSILSQKTKTVDDFIEKQEDNFYKTYDEELFKNFLRMSKDNPKYNQTKEKLYEKFNNSEAVVMGLINSTGVFQIDKEGILEGFDIKEYPEGVEYLADTSKEITYMILPHPKLDSFYILIIKKIFEDDGTFLGIFSYRVPNNELEALLNNITEFEEIGEIYLINDDYFLITRSKFLKKTNSGILTQIVNTLNAEQCVNNYLIPLKKGEEINILEENVINYITYRGEKVLGIHSVIKTPKWCLLIEVNEKDISKKSFNELTLKYTIIFALITLVLIILYYVIEKSFSSNKNR
ncbi:MAG: cache domain-containing protein [Candidatus Pacearchaeota archaeon]|nr:cache domain-containing protein [Candidatus Pacearchaeota archaeon]